MINLYNQQNNTNSPPSPVAEALKGKVAEKKGFEQYVDPTGDFDNKELKYGIWYVRHRVLFYRLLVGGLVAINILLWSYSIWQWGAYAIFGWQDDQRLSQQLSHFTNYEVLHQSTKPQPLRHLTTYSLPSGTSKYDLLTEVSNPNKSFLVQFDYYYIVGSGKKTNRMSATVLPQETTLTGALGLDTSEYSGDAVFVIENIAWKRISPHAITDPIAWQTERLHFLVDAFHFTPAVSADGPNTSIISFTYTNQTAYSYVEPHFYVGLYNQGALVGVLPLVLDTLEASESKPVDLRSFVPTIQVTEVKVFPLINVYDSSVYLPPRGE